MMIALKSLSGLSVLFRRPSENICTTVLQPGEFRRLIRRERLRSDRTSETFSLIVMTPRHPQHAKRLLPELIRVLHSRLRATDDVGWIEESRLGVLLPDTPSTGAWTVVDHIVHLLPKEVLSPICEVYTYPSFGDGLREPEDPRIDGDSERLAVGENGERIDTGTTREVRRMETLFAVSVPAWKRGIDIVGALIGLAVLSPLLALIALAVKWTSPGPVFFMQFRRGQSGKAFVLYKFRSMVSGAEAMQRELRHMNEQDGPAFKIKSDPRITTVGRFLRRTGLDEFPQLWNGCRLVST